MILVLVEHDGAAPDQLSSQALSLGRRLATAIDAPLEAAVIGEDGRKAAATLSSFGASRAHVVVHESLDPYAPEAWARGLTQMIDALGPSIVIASGGERSTEVLARVAAMREVPLAANCTEVLPGEPFVVTRQRWGGSLLEETRVSAPLKLLTVAPHAVPVEETTGVDEAVVEEFVPTLTERELRVRVSGRVESSHERVSLAEAKVVVGGGRGVGADGFGPLEELAELLGGTVGVSRVVTSAGWRPHSDQIGQTGARIAPDLYIACGISGAIQHMVGCKAAKRILVINSDADAPIVAKADYAVIGDLHQVVPALVAAIREAKSSGVESGRSG